MDYELGCRILMGLGIWAVVGGALAWLAGSCSFTWTPRERAAERIEPRFYGRGPSLVVPLIRK